ncbi:MAG: chorismate mutase [Thermoplasmatota archaeon]
MERIHELRKRIDKIDERIIELLEERAEVAEKIGDIKEEEGIPVIDTDREKEVLESAGKYKRIFERIIQMCKELQDV